MPDGTLTSLLDVPGQVVIKTYEAPDSPNKHINKMHRGVLAPSAISKEEAEAVVSGC